MRWMISIGLSEGSRLLKIAESIRFTILAAGVVK
jgi:hypothetical protein